MLRSIGPPPNASKSSLRYSHNNIILTEPHPLPITNAKYRILRPVYILATVLLCVCALDAAQRKNPLAHVVKRGDTLSGIAARYATAIFELAKEAKSLAEVESPKEKSLKRVRKYRPFQKQKVGT